MSDLQDRLNEMARRYGVAGQSNVVKMMRHAADQERARAAALAEGEGAALGEPAIGHAIAKRIQED